MHYPSSRLLTCGMIVESRAWYTLRNNLIDDLPITHNLPPCDATGLMFLKDTLRKKGAETAPLGALFGCP